MSLKTDAITLIHMNLSGAGYSIKEIQVIDKKLRRLDATTLRNIKRLLITLLDFKVCIIDEESDLYDSAVEWLTSNNIAKYEDGSMDSIVLVRKK